MSVKKNPEPIDIYELIERKNPDIYSQYPELNLKELHPNQLERLLRGDPPEDVLGIKPLKIKSFYMINKRVQEMFEKENKKGYCSNGVYPRDTIPSLKSRVIRKPIIE